MCKYWANRSFYCANHLGSCKSLRRIYDAYMIWALIKNPKKIGLQSSWWYETKEKPWKNGRFLSLMGNILLQTWFISSLAVNRKFWRNTIWKQMCENFVSYCKKLKIVVLLATLVFKVYFHSQVPTKYPS